MPIGLNSCITKTTFTECPLCTHHLQCQHLLPWPVLACSVGGTIINYILDITAGSPQNWHLTKYRITSCTVTSYVWLLWDKPVLTTVTLGYYLWYDSLVFVGTRMVTVMSVQDMMFVARQMLCILRHITTCLQ